MGRPNGGERLEDEIAGWQTARIDGIVCLLDQQEIVKLDLMREETLCKGYNIAYEALPIPDRGVPADAAAFDKTVAALAEKLRAGKSVVIHCHAGIGRSSLVAACVLIALGMAGDKAMALVEKARGLLTPNVPAQKEWIKAFEARQTR